MRGDDIGWNNDFPVDEMKMILLLDGWTLTETNDFFLFRKQDGLLRVDRHYIPHIDTRARCRLILGGLSTGDVGSATFASRWGALHFLELIAEYEENDTTGAGNSTPAGRMES